MIGQNIKSQIDSSGLTYTQIADRLNITYQYLFKIFNKESVETRYLFDIAKILNISVTAFFEDEPGGKVPLIDIDKLKIENEELKREIENLKETLKDKKFIIDELKEDIEDLKFEKDDVVSLLPSKKRKIFEFKEAWFKYEDEVDTEHPELVEPETIIRGGKKPFTEEQKAEIDKLGKERFRLTFQKAMNNPITRRLWTELLSEKELTSIFERFCEMGS